MLLKILKLFIIAILPGVVLADGSYYCHPYYNPYGCPTPTPTPTPPQVIDTYCTAGPSDGYQLTCGSSSLSLFSHISPDVYGVEYRWTTDCPASFSDSHASAPHLLFSDIDNLQSSLCRVFLQVLYPDAYARNYSYYMPPQYEDATCSAVVLIPDCVSCNEVDIEEDVLILDVSSRDSYLVIRKISVRIIRSTDRKRAKRQARQLRRLARATYKEIWSVARSLSPTVMQCTGNTINCVTVSYTDELATITADVVQLEEIAEALTRLLQRTTGKRRAGRKLLHSVDQQSQEATQALASIPEVETRCF